MARSDLPPRELWPSQAEEDAGELEGGVVHDLSRRESNPPPFPELLLTGDLMNPHSTISEAIYERGKGPAIGTAYFAGDIFLTRFLSFHTKHVLILVFYYGASAVSLNRYYLNSLV